MGFPDYKRDLTDPLFGDDRMLDRYFHCGQSAVFNGAPPEAEPDFKRYVLSALLRSLDIPLHPLQLVICGSAHLGFSPVPKKLGKVFDGTHSDIDIAIVSDRLFDHWWEELQSLDLDSHTRKQVADELFWGFINPDSVRHVSAIGRNWWTMFGGLNSERSRGIRGRLYRTHWAMQNYHRQAIIGGRKELEGIR